MQTENGLYIYKINGWKKKSKAGATYLSLSVDRYIPKGEEPQQHRKDEDDSDIPF